MTPPTPPPWGASHTRTASRSARCTQTPGYPANIKLLSIHYFFVPLDKSLSHTKFLDLKEMFSPEIILATKISNIFNLKYLTQFFIPQNLFNNNKF